MLSNCEKCIKETVVEIPVEVCNSCGNKETIKVERTRSKLSKVFRLFYNDKIIGYIHDYTEYGKGFNCELSGCKTSADRYLGWNVKTQDEAVQSLIKSHKRALDRLIVMV
ncbi:hypothetical protein DRH27_03595 [Candidatus Falkowbacteria bacterium]|nr:MAG: hypothetical protein DRH27_03595 [Candidatus Falkowbacteria bacterium]